jgi:HPt (histidine-containing phosphotransfer) domain-containing protein
MLPPQSLAAITSSMANDSDMAELIDLYVEEMGGRAQSLQSHLNTANWKLLANEAHKLRGSAGGHGFDTIGTCAAQLEDQLRQAAGHEQEILQSLKQHVDDLIGMCLRAKAR